jgi:indolepyruvate ferredoxin oxidoreductase beta subunit
MKPVNVLMVGIGGQGIILASDILGDAAKAGGYDVKKTDTIGMAQRGGSVTSHIRIADHVYSPLMAEGSADILLAFEKLEAARWSHFLRQDGVAIVNNQVTPPQSISLGTTVYPSHSEILDLLKRRTDRVYFIDGAQQAQEAGDIRAVNILMLGYMSAFLPISAEVWKDCISQRLPVKILDLNLRAFDQGREGASHVAVG